MTNTLDWANIFEEEGPRLLRFLKRFGPRISAEDISQDAFTKLVAANPADVTNPQAYLITTARNLALNDIRRQNNAKTNTCADIETVAGADQTDPEAQLIASEASAAAASALAALDPQAREALLLHLAEGLTQFEVADRLGLSRRTVQRRISEALAQLHLALADPKL